MPHRLRNLPLIITLITLISSSTTTPSTSCHQHGQVQVHQATVPRHTGLDTARLDDGYIFPISVSVTLFSPCPHSKRFTPFFCHCTSSSSCRRLHEEFHYSITVVQAIITFFVISNFFCTTFFDPGIIKRGMFAVFIVLHALYYTKPSSFATESPVSLQRFLMRMLTTLDLRCSKKL